MISEIQIKYTNRVKVSDRVKITSEEEAASFLSPYFQDFMEYREVVFGLFLNRGNQALGVVELSRGGVASSIIDVKMIFQAALKVNASAIILAHNHPSGNLKPSVQDIEITKKVKSAAELLDMVLLDHLILTSENYYSMSANKNVF